MEISSEASYTLAPLLTESVPEYKRPLTAIIGDNLVFIRKFGVVPFGMLLNIFTVIVLTRRTIRRSPLTPYLFIMAFNNTLYLFLDMFSEIFAMYNGTTDVYCKIVLYLTIATAAFSDLLVTGMALNKTLAIIRPLHVATIITRRKTVIIISLVFLLCFGLMLICLWSYGLVNWCEPLKKYRILTEIEIYFGMVKTYGSCAVILICTTICLVSLARQRSQLGNSRSAKSDNDSQVTIMLLCTMVLYLITNIPLTTFVAVRRLILIRWDIDFLIFAFVLMLRSVGNSIDFLIYLAGTQLFRNEFYKIFCPCLLEQLIKSKTTTYSDTRSTTISDIA